MGVRGVTLVGVPEADEGLSMRGVERFGVEIVGIRSEVAWVGVVGIGVDGLRGVGTVRMLAFVRAVIERCREREDGVFTTYSSPLLASPPCPPPIVLTSYSPEFHPPPSLHPSSSLPAPPGLPRLHPQPYRKSNPFDSIAL